MKTTHYSVKRDQTGWPKKKQDRWREMLIGCELHKFTYDSEKQQACLWVGDGNCTDMTGAIHFVRSMFSDVKRLYVWDSVQNKHVNLYYLENDRWYCQESDNNVDIVPKSRLERGWIYNGQECEDRLKYNYKTFYQHD